MKRTRKILKPIAVFILTNMLVQLCTPFVAKALTSGPSQPEFSSFEPINTTQLVDAFTGDFNYNIPLMDIEGYPINIAYHSGITMDQEASWVGLGWNINPGVINRGMRGLPDDFKADEIKTQFNIKDNVTWGAKVGGGIEFFGVNTEDATQGKNGLGAGLSASFGISWNNYRGVGIDYSIDPSISAGYGNKSLLTANLGVGYSSASGFSSQKGLSVHYKTEETDGRTIGGSIGLGVSSSSRQGLQQISFQAGVSVTTADNISHTLRGENNYSLNGGSAISFAKPCFVPQISYPMNNYSFSFKGKLGESNVWLHPNVMAEGYYSNQSLSTHQKTGNGYGYMYLDHATESADEDAMLDFNREKDGDVTLTRPNLPVTNLTYDIYSVSGQGIGGVYRPYRSEVGAVYDPRVENSGSNSSPGVEAGIGNLFHLGVNISNTSSTSHSGKWSVNNNCSLGFLDNRANDFLYEPCYFKQAGEKTQTVFNATQAVYTNPNGAYNLHLTGSGRDATLTDSVFDQNGSVAGTFKNDNKYRGQRAKRHQPITFLNRDEVQHAGINPTMESYALNTPFSVSSPAVLSRAGFPAHHTGEIHTLRGDGTRYIYGIPAYNLKQKDVCFNISGNTGNNGYVNYYPRPGHHIGSFTFADDSVINSRGKDNYFRQTNLPPYAYSYLLTQVLSPDYVDVYGDGVTPDDIGTAVKFNYTKLYGQGGVKPSNYRWRAPYAKNAGDTIAIANYDEGFKSVKNDDKASYLYGEKEIWYMHSVVTKNYVAQFYLSQREDGLGVRGDFGGRDYGQRLMKLDSIVLYSRSDLLINKTKAVKIKGVHFTYDYTLCTNVENNSEAVLSDGSNLNKGKLTLKKIYFTYGTSKKGKFSPYTFDYSTVNNSYQFTARDRWGGYKAEDGKVPNREFPYVDMSNINSVTNRSAAADNNAQIWSLTRINLPSGGNIQVSYEADDYAYVQNKPAMQMFKLIGMNYTSETVGMDNYLYNINDLINNNYLFFKLPTPLTYNQYKNWCIGDLSKVYFKCMTHVNKQSKPNDYDYVPGFADIEDYGLVPQPEFGTSSTIGWIKLKSVPVEDGSNWWNISKIQPIAKSAMQYAKVNFPAKIYPGSEDDGTEGNFEFLLGVWDETKKSVSGFYNSLRDDGYADQVVLNKSWIRLYCPTAKKPGGGNRVKQISLSDSWGSQVNNGNGSMSYGQQFSYTTIENGREISSGVAAWEPSIGADENPFFDIRGYSDEKIDAISDFHQVMLPMGESFAPSPTVGYREVKVTDLTQIGVPGTGYKVEKYYTAKEFPTVFEETPVNREHEKDAPDFLSSLLGSSKSEEDLTVSQGYSIRLNDMHGKPYSTEIHNNAGDKISSVSYYYRSNSTPQGLCLQSNVPTITHDGWVHYSTIGEDVDMVADTREHYSDIEGSNWGVNVDITFIGGWPIPVPIPSGIPQHSSDETTFRSAVLTRVVQQSGILDSVVAVDENSVISTKNLAYDPETGEVLLTQTRNAYNDPVYNFTYPAHWAYEGMGSAYTNIGFQMDNINIWHGKIKNYIGAKSASLMSGDELYLFNSSNSSPRKVWVYSPDGGQATLLEQNGKAVDSANNCSLKVVRSGKRNMSSTPIGSVTTLANPIHWIDNIAGYLKFSNVLDASAAQFSDKWKMYICGKLKNGTPDANNVLSTVINPFNKGIRGIWRKKLDLVYMDVRKQKSPMTNARTDGQFRSFFPYWVFNNLTTVSNDTSAHWTWTKQATQYSPYGFEIENKDALNNYTAALYGFNNSLPLAVASNAKYSQVAYDGFEDYYCDTLGVKNPVVTFRSPHWNLINCTKVATKTSLVTTQHHTGRYSLMIKSAYQDTITVKLNNCATPANDANIFPEYSIKPSDVIYGFFPDTGKKYLLSMWVKKDSADCKIFNYSGIGVKIEFDAAIPTSTVYLSPTGEVIEGWQKIEGSFLIPSGFSYMRIYLRNYSPVGSTVNTYLDDLRIHPFLGNMKSFVYDPVSMHEVAELDENNFATFYEYDEEGKLIRVKKETVNGILTVKESRMSQHRIR
jgi:hypothetical protein